jgi:hypothetical protein
VLNRRYQRELIGMFHLKNIWIAHLLDLQRRRCSRIRILPGISAPRSDQAQH